jgi:hypothetical protein
MVRIGRRNEHTRIRSTQTTDFDLQARTTFPHCTTDQFHSNRSAAHSGNKISSPQSSHVCCFNSPSREKVIRGYRSVEIKADRQRCPIDAKPCADGCRSSRTKSDQPVFGIVEVVLLTYLLVYQRRSYGMYILRHGHTRSHKRAVSACFGAPPITPQLLLPLWQLETTGPMCPQVALTVSLINSGTVNRQGVGFFVTRVPQ